MRSHHATQGTYLHPVRPPLPQTGSQSPAEHQLCCGLPCFLVLRVLEMLVYSRLECYLQYRLPKTYCHLKMELKLSVCVKLAGHTADCAQCAGNNKLVRAVQWTADAALQLPRSTPVFPRPETETNGTDQTAPQGQEERTGLGKTRGWWNFQKCSVISTMMLG